MEDSGRAGAADIRAGRAFADLSSWRKVLVRGPDARAWLGDLVTAGIEDLRPGQARRSLLLTPTGRIRADFTVALPETDFLLIQDPAQPAPIGELLAPYVLSSEVELEDRTEPFGLLAFPGREPEGWYPGEVTAPSCQGPGFDLLIAPGREPEARRASRGLLEAGAAALEAWRIERGAARFPGDLTAQSLPHEAGLDDAIEYGKGCFLGQEALAKVRNLGHPPVAVLAARARGRVVPSESVVAGRQEVGEVTSAAPIEGGTAVILRVRWKAREADLTTASGLPLEVRGLAGGTT